MDIFKVAEIIHKIADGFEENGIKCLSDQSAIVVRAIREQLMSGQDGDGTSLEPTYLNDEYFLKHKWHHKDENTGKEYFGAQGYIDWKHDITPPSSGELLGLPPRTEDVPNLFIDGTFHREISAVLVDDTLQVSPGHNKGPDIVKKYGDRILDLGPSAVEYFNREYLLPSIAKFFKDCGYQ